ncbi:hypothetical protein, partial [Klebsiella pneumoniae]|uniref:hypothetical protein n=1 Tax=Klebsiella pneumoniae TaxID=573 RepID=UPI00272F287F
RSQARRALIDSGFACRPALRGRFFLGNPPACLALPVFVAQNLLSGGLCDCHNRGAEVPCGVFDRVRCGF